MSYSQYQQYGGSPYGNGPDAEAGQAGVSFSLPKKLFKTQNNIADYSQSQYGRPDMQHEMSNYSQTSQYSNTGAAAIPPTHGSVLTQGDYLQRVDYAKSEIHSLTSNIQEIGTLHQRALSSPDSSTSAQLENLVTQTQLKNTKIRDQIKYLELDAAKTQDGSKSIKTRQFKVLKGEFEKALKDYQQEEVGYRQRYREQIARQYRIVNPEASEQEVQEASEMDWGSEGVFQTAVSF